MRDVHQAEADGGHERPTLPDKMQVLHRLAQAFGYFFRSLRRTVFQQYPELVTAQTGQGVALAQSRLQQRTDMPQQLVTRGMPAGVVDQFELVQIEKHQGMPGRLARQIVQRLLQAILELPTVGQPGQGVVGRLPGQVGNVLPLLGHVVQHQHGATDFTG
ncbi:hypothetical protein D3C78_626970 [compost metagenome]